jgi:hypothetical protein
MSRAIIVASRYAIPSLDQTDEVFGTHRDRLYGIRSGIFHGTARLSDSELSIAARGTVTLCGRIVLALIGKEGTRIPSISETHFPNVAPTPP